MVSRSPWRVLLPPQTRCELTMTKLHEIEESKLRHSRPSSPDTLNSKYPIAIPPPPPPLSLHKRKPDVPLANTQQHFETTLRPDTEAPKRPKPLRAHSSSPSNNRSASPGKCRGSRTKSTVSADLAIGSWLESLGLGELTQNFIGEGFEKVNSTLITAES